jgi:hypothetical protein
MKAKQIAILIVFFLFTFPLLIKVIIYSSHISNPEATINRTAELIGEATVPWWVGVINWFADLGTLGALLIIGLIIFLRWIGEAK